MSVACVRSWWIHLKERDHLEDLEADRKILKWIFKKSDAVWTGVTWHRIGQVAGSCEHGNEPLSSINWGLFSD